MKRFLVWLPAVLIAMSLLAGGSGPPNGNALLEQELARLTERGLTYRLVDGSVCGCGPKGSQWVEAYDPCIGQTEHFPLDALLTPLAPTSRGIPVLTIDARQLDTNQFAWKYHYVSTVLVSGLQGMPLPVGDVDHDGRSEAYGIYQDSSGFFATRIYELDDSMRWVLRHTYPFNSGGIDNIGDIDLNGLMEVFAYHGDSVFAFEQPTLSSLPTVSKFRHRRYYFDAFGIPNLLNDMNGDGRAELMYRGSELDSIGVTVPGTYVIKYDSSTNNLVRIWGRRLPQTCLDVYCCANIAAGDFDGDGLQEFVTSSFRGNVYDVEYVENDSFTVVWSDSLPIAGRVAAGDVDGNGIEEFFVGGVHSEPDGYVHNRVYAYETTGNNTYQPFFEFNIFPSGTFFVDLYTCADIDGDGRKELLLSIAPGVFIFKGVAPHQYSLFYYKNVRNPDGFSVGDVDGDRVPELLLGQQLAGVRQTQVFRLDSSLIVRVSEPQPSVATIADLSPNYPNPFNGSTTISYQLQHYSRIQFTIVDLTGKEVTRLVDEYQQRGFHSVAWDPSSTSDVASGVYFARLYVEHQTLAQKLLYLK